MVEEHDRKQCAAITRAGGRCKHPAQPGTVYCHVHQVLAEPTEQAAAHPSAVAEAAQEAAPEAEAQTGAAAGAGDMEPETRQQMVEEIDELIEGLKEGAPAFRPPPYSPQALIAMIKQNLEHLPPAMRVDVLYRLRDAIGGEQGADMETWQGVWYMLHYWRHYQETFFQRLGEGLSLPVGQLRQLTKVLNEDLFDLDTWKGMWFMVSYSAKYQADLIRRRFIGEYDTDEWGLDWEFLEAIRPFFTFLYKYYWRVEASGLQNIPDYERALIVANHSGQLPFDGAMIGAAVLMDHPSQRLVRNLYADWFPTLPFLAPLFEKMGQTLASVDNGTRLLEQEELVAVYPEGYKGVGKLYKDRYRLGRFGRGGFVRMALETQAPIVPTAVVGAEETYVSLAKSDLMAKLIGFPYFPISPTWPWLGLLGLVPLPTKWYIDFGEPIPTDAYGPDAAENLVLVSQLTDQVRNIVQEMLYERLAQRRSIFLG